MTWISRTNRTRSSGRKWPALSTRSVAQGTYLVDAGGAIISTETDSDSHGVSDPSGQARGHWPCAQRGRSRHGSYPDRDTAAWLRAAKSAATSYGAFTCSMPKP